VTAIIRLEEIVNQVLAYTEEPATTEIQPAICALLNDFVQGGLVIDYKCLKSNGP